MDNRLTEQQQIEVLKNFWKEYGLSIIVGITFAMVLTFGWRFYQSYKIKREDHAAFIYQQIMVADAKAQTKTIKTQATYLREHFSHTPYASLSALLLAKQAVNENQLNVAIKQLNWVISKAKSSVFRQIARLRLARIYLELKQPEHALKVLEKVDDKIYLSLIEQIKGEAYLQLNQKDKALMSYETALKLSPPSMFYRSFLSMKLADL